MLCLIRPPPVSVPGGVPILGLCRVGRSTTRAARFNSPLGWRIDEGVEWVRWDYWSSSKAWPRRYLLTAGTTSADQGRDPLFFLQKVCRGARVRYAALIANLGRLAFEVWQLWAR